MSFLQSTLAAGFPAALLCSRRAVLPHWQVRCAKHSGSGGGGRSGGGGTAGVATHSAQRVPLAVVARRRGEQPWDLFSMLQKAECRMPTSCLASAGPSGTPRSRRSSSVSLPRLAKEYALPALGLLIAASFVGPILGGLVATALGLGAVLAFAAGKARGQGYRPKGACSMEQLSPRKFLLAGSMCQHVAVAS